MGTMKKFINGVIVEETPEDIEERERSDLEQSQTPTLEERVTAVESGLTDLEYIITGEVKTDAK